MDNEHEESSSSSTEKKKDMQCPICKQKTDKTCSACKSVAYCCVEHQKLDWKNHKQVCQPFVIKKTEGMGMGWVAMRDLKAGLELLREDPVIQAPGLKWSSFTDKGRNCLTCAVKMNTIGTCSTCHWPEHSETCETDSVSRDNKRTCYTCSWPVCSEKCEKDPLHSENECKELAARKLKYPPPPSWSVGMVTMFMRANALKARDPKKFKQLMALQDFYTIPSSNQKLQEIDLPDEMFDALSGPNCLDREEFRKLLRISKVNSFDLTCVTNKHRPRRTYDNFLIFLKASRLNYSCFPNCAFTFGWFGEVIPYEIQICTTIPVSQGEELTINYYEWCALQSTIERQKIINLAGFTCKCKRCLDPTELGSFLSGIKCFNCSRHLKAASDDGNTVGFLLPANPFDIESPDPTFECHRCHVKFPYSKVMATLPNNVRHAFINIEQWTKVVGYHAPESIKAIISNKNFKDNLHKNHWLIQAAMRHVNKMESKRSFGMCEDRVEFVRNLVFLLKIYDKLFPGLTKLRYGALMTLYLEVPMLGLRFGSRMSGADVKKLLQLEKTTKTEVFKFINGILYVHIGEEASDFLTPVLRFTVNKLND